MDEGHGARGEPLDRLEAALARARRAAERIRGREPAVRGLVEAVAEAVDELDRLIGLKADGHRG
ncbi:hypothetical protein [Thermaurantiacus sp.]